MKRERERERKREMERELEREGPIDKNNIYIETESDRMQAHERNTDR